MKNRKRIRLVLKFAVILCLLPASSLIAHLPFETSTIARLQHGVLELSVTFSNTAATTLVSELSGGIEDQAAFDKARPLLLKQAPQLYEVAAAGEALALQRADVRMKAGGEIEFFLVYPNPVKRPVRFDAVFLRKLPSDFFSSLAFFDAAETQLGGKILTRAVTSFEVALPTDAPPISGNSQPSEPTRAAPGFREFLKLGIEHILTGYDHLLFLCGLLVACRSIRAMLGVVTCFTLAHSITLALAALNVVTIPSRIVEPLIAASIVFVGMENLVCGEAGPSRAWVAFGFGFVHGFGFASGLQATGLGTSGASLIVPLFSFNLGVEIGQIAVAALVVPLLWLLRKQPLFACRGTRAVSAGVVLLGGWWLLQRTLLS